MLRSITRRLWRRTELRVYCCRADQIENLPRSTAMRRDVLEDLQAYVPTDADQMPPNRYRDVARARLAQGHHLYTRVEDGLLVQYGWLIDRQTRSQDASLGMVFFPPPDSAVLYDYYTHPSARGRGLHFAALCQRLHDARDLTGARQALTYIYATNRVSIRGAERARFEYAGSLVMTRRGFLCRRRIIAASPDFKAGLL
jgi:hypothetical protein